jgi:predicted phage replisome organizer
MAKRYYWLKLPDDFFRQKPIKKLRKIAGGDTYTIIYLKMLLIAMKQDGRLYFDGVEDDFYDDLALDLDEEAENVKVTVMFLVRQGLMELIDDSEYLLTEVENMTGSETASTKRSRACRARQKEQKALQCNTEATLTQQTFSNCNVEKEIEIEKEIDKEKDKTLCQEVITSRQEQIFISLPLVTGSGSYDVTFDYVNSLRELYPAIDVEQEFRKMYGWLDSNPTNRKTQRGIKRFITGWLARAQDRAPSSKTVNNRNMSTSQYMESTAGWYSE